MARKGQCGCPASARAESGRPRRGRPLDPALDGVIQTAALQVLLDTGYAGLTMDAVALQAGVSKATIYRRWASKVELLVSVIDTASDESLVAPDTGCLRDDLVALLTAFGTVLAGPGGSVTRALLGVLNHEPVLAAAYQRGPQARWGEAFQTVYRRAVARGEVSPAAPTSLAAEAGPGVFLERWLVPGMMIDDQLPAAVVDQLMMPLLREL